MTDKKSSAKRRKLLKSIGAGSGAILVGSSLPEKWAKPVVNSIVLPVHARASGTPSPTASPTASPTTTASPPLSCLGSQNSVDTADARIFVNYDGDTNCGVELAVSGGSAMLDILNRDTNTPHVTLGIGSDWVYPGRGSDVPAGTYTYTVTRANDPNQGVAFDVTITIAISGSGSSTVLTVTLDNLVPA